MSAAARSVLALVRRRRLELVTAGTVLFCCAYFFQGGGWNQNAHFVTTLAMVEDGTVYLDNYRRSTGDLAVAGDHVASAKAIATSLTAVPGYLVARTLTLAVHNPGDQFILRAYITTVLTSGLALAALALVLLSVLRRRLPLRDATFLALALTLATPLFPNSTMLTSHPLAILAAFGSFVLLDRAHLAEGPPSGRLLLAAGLAAGGAAAFEYMLAVLWLPLGVFALWLTVPRRRAAWFGAGLGLAALVPLVHHTLLYGHPLQTGYGQLTDARFAADAARGLLGFDGFSLGRLYELTFGTIRGFFYLSPLLLGCIPGGLRLLRDRATRPVGWVSAAGSWGILALVASLAYWHSGSSVGSRYALVFIAFSALPIATLVAGYRPWLFTGAGVGFAFMVMATSVTAIPPTPGRLPYENVIRWLWARFSTGRLASWQQAVVLRHDIAAGEPTLPFAFNLGQLMGLPGLWSLLPFVLGLLLAALLLRRTLRPVR